MKKTSKKLLSFFLAVVMVVTSCSVGLTAFAGEQDTTGTYWNNTVESDEAFDAINDLIDTYVPTILGIEVSGKTIGSLLGMDQTQIGNATLKGVIEAASPMLMGVLGNANADVKTFLISHSSVTGITDTTWKNKYLKYYSYLDGTDADTMSFYGLYTFCENNKNNDNADFAAYCTETLGKLNILLQVCSAAESSYKTKVSNADTAYNNLRNAVTVASIKSDIKVSDVAEIEYNGTKIKDLTGDDYANGIQFCNDALEAAGVSFRASNPAEALMYYYVIPTGYAYTLNGANANSKGISYATALLYAKLAKDGGKEIAGITIPTAADDQPTLFAKDVYGKLADTNGTASIAANRNYDTFTSSSFEAINKSILLATGEYEDMAAVTKAVEDAKITDAQLEELKAHAVDGQYSTLYDYINSDECTLSSYAKTMLNAIYSAQTNRSDFSMLNNEIATSVAAAKAYKSTITNYKTWGQMRNGGAEMPVILLINDIISGVMTKNDIASGTNIASANIVSKPIFDFLEANKLNTAIKPATSSVSYSYSAYAVPSEYAVEAVNGMLNETVGGILDPTTDVGAMVAPIIGGFLETDIKLFESDGSGIVNDIWSKLYNKPIETVFNLIPVLAVLVDEVVAPMLLTEGDGQLDALINDPETLFGGLALKNGNTDVGLTALHFDLNTVLPNVLSWLSKGTVSSSLKTYADYAELPVGASVDTSVYMFTGVYVADKALQGLKNLSTLESTFVNDSKMDATLAKGLVELIKEVAGFASEAVDDYMDQYGNEKRYGIDYTSTTKVTQKGLNNVFVAFPRLIDSIGKKFIAKYGVNSDWTTIYSGKYTTKTKTFTDGSVTQVYNKTLEDFKALATANDGAKVLKSLVEIVIGNWANAFIDIANDTLSSNNKLTNKLPLVQGLLQSLGGLGEKSVITDLLNGLFDLTRESSASFTFKENADTGFVGFSTNSGIFLLANIQYKDSAGNNKGIIPLISSLINSNKTASKLNASNNSFASSIKLAGQKSAAGTDYSKLLTKKNVKAADELISKLDKILKSLLANTSINDFTLTANDNVLAGVMTTVVNYLGQNNTNNLIKLLDQYVEVFNTKAVSKKVSAKDVYTNKKLSAIVISTYQLIEDIVDYVMYDKNSGILKQDTNKIIAGAITGIVSPDSLSVRMSGDYSTAANSLKGVASWKSVNSINFGVKTGNKDSFYSAMGEALSGIAAIVSAVITSSYTSANRTNNLYSVAIYPVLNTLAKSVGASGVMSPSAFNAATPQKQLVTGLIKPISNIIAKLYNKPATFIINVVQGLGGILDDNSFVSIVKGIQNVVDYTINGALSVVGGSDALKAPSLVKFIVNALNGGVIVAKSDKTGVNLKLLKTTKNAFVSLINQLLDGKFVLPAINWKKLVNAKPGEALLLIYGYVVDTILNSSLISNALKGQAPEIIDLVENLSAAEILTLVSEILSITQSPVEAYWTFKEYASKLTGRFYYPRGITNADSLEAIDNLDTLVQNVFPLLNALGVTDIKSLNSLVNDKLFTNEILTKIATAAYGAIEDVLVKNKLQGTVKELGIDLSTKGVAKYLMDKSYGNTYSSAAATLKKTSSWKKVKTLNWGFTNGTAKAQTGFINGLAAILRPANGLLSIFLVEGKDLNLDILNDETRITLLSAIKGLNVDPIKLTEIKGENGAVLTLQVKQGVLTLKIDSKMSSKNSIVKCNLYEVVKEVLNAIGDVSVKVGTNGYENAIVPILEAFICKNVKTYKAYVADYKKAKDNLLIDILKPIFTLVSDITKKPANTLTAILPNVAYFLDSNGLAQAVGNLLAPITSKKGLVGILKKHKIDIDKLIKVLAKKDLGKIITDAIGIKTKLTLNLSDMSTCNIQDIVVPLVNKILKDKKLGIKIPDISFKKIASHGKIKVVKSAAKNDKGKYTTRRVIARKGEVFVAVIRYVADVVIKNATPIKKLLLNIDAIKKNKMIKDILNSVFGTIRTAQPDDFVRVVFYLLSDNGYKDSFFDYTDFKTGTYEFSFGDMDEDFCRKLAPMLDGLVGGLLGDKGGLLGLITDMVYKDEIISKIATGLYGAVEGVKVAETNLTYLLTAADIDFSTYGVANLLTDKKYGKKYEGAATVIRNAGSWKNVDPAKLVWGVKDRDSFLHALVAVLRPIYGVVDVLLNDGRLELLDSVSIKGSDGYTSFMVPLMEAFGMYNIKTQYQYREDMYREYDSILLDILNPLMDKVEDILNAPIEILMDILPNLSLFFANNGLLQLIDNLLTPVSSILETLKPIVNVNDVLAAINLDIDGLLKKIGINAKVKIDVYDLKKTLLPLIGAENVVSLLNGILSIIKIKGTPLGLVLPEINWFQLASHGKYKKVPSQVSCLGERITVKSDQDETLIAVLRYLINTINYKDNYDTIVNLITGLLGDGVSDSISGVIDQVLGMVKGDADTVIEELVDLLQSIAG